MKIAVTSQNLRTITAHAGKARKFLVFEAVGTDGLAPIAPITVPKEMSIHAHPVDQPHPLDGVDVLITASCGQGFLDKMSRRGIKVLQTSEEDPVRAAEAAARNEPLPEPLPHTH